jgi:hypothetical protein
MTGVMIRLLILFLFSNLFCGCLLEVDAVYHRGSGATSDVDEPSTQSPILKSYQK